LGIKAKDVVIVTGIGCSSKINSYLKTYGFHGTHGRALPIATGIKLANRELTVIAAGGDGDGYSIGTNHFIHAIRRNVDITYVVMDNRIYGLTRGQTSPTSSWDFKTKTTPFGASVEPVRPLALAMSCGIKFLAQGFSGDLKQLSSLIQRGIEHSGFSLINVLSPCVTHNKVNTYKWFKKNVTNLAENTSYDPLDRKSALDIVEDRENIYTGLIFEEKTKSYEESLDLFPKEPIMRQELGNHVEALRKLLRDEFS
jgi:2-oxoglutarate ferredoxin oxidoreductase subunit beta